MKKLRTWTVRLLGMAAAAVLFSGCQTGDTTESTTTPPDAAAVEVVLTGSLTTGGAGASPLISVEGCDTSPTHVVLRLSYPDGSFYVKRFEVEELRDTTKTTFYAPPGEDVVLYTVAIHYDEDASNSFYIGAPFAQVNLALSGARVKLGTIKPGEAYHAQIDLTKLVPFDFEITAARDTEATYRFLPEQEGDALLVPFRIKVSWVPEGSTAFDVQGPVLFASNGYLCAEFDEYGECSKWLPVWGTSNWGTPEPAMYLPADRYDWTAHSGEELYNWISPIYITGVNFGYFEYTRFYLPTTTCEAKEGKARFWIVVP